MSAKCQKRTFLQSSLSFCFPNHGPRPDSNEPRLVTGALHSGEDLRARRVNQETGATLG
jgi:hypothetical protein